MLNLRINGGNVPYDTLEDARKAAHGELLFWRETLELCAKDEKFWNDFINDLWQNGGAEEAVRLHALFKESNTRRWPLMAFVLSDCNNCELWKSISSAFGGDVDGLVAWLQGPAARVLSGAPELVVDEALKAALLAAIDGKENLLRLWLQGRKDAGRRVPSWMEQELTYWLKRQVGSKLHAEEKARMEAEAARLRRERALYRVYDLKTGTLETLDEAPSGGWKREHKTTKLVLRRIEPGTFMMGSPNDEANRQSSETQHRVTLTQPFYIGVFAVTRAQWEIISDGNTDSLNRCPVVNVSYNGIRGAKKGAEWPNSREVDGDSFLGKLRAKLKQDGFDLPTEAQWEYACRAGTTGAYAGDVDSMAWAYGNSDNRIHDVGMKDPNAWGLYDLHGNVWEWCLDWYGDYHGNETDPKGPVSGSYRVDRGGSRYSSSGSCRSAYRGAYSPGDANDKLGFRLCCSAGPSE